MSCPKPKINIILVGNAGVGKSTLSQAFSTRTVHAFTFGPHRQQARIVELTTDSGIYHITDAHRLYDSVNESTTKQNVSDLIRQLNLLAAPYIICFIVTLNLESIQSADLQMMRVIKKYLYTPNARYAIVFNLLSTDIYFKIAENASCRRTLLMSYEQGAGVKVPDNDIMLVTNKFVNYSLVEQNELLTNYVKKIETSHIKEQQQKMKQHQQHQRPQNKRASTIPPFNAHTHNVNHSYQPSQRPASFQGIPQPSFYNISSPCNQSSYTQQQQQQQQQQFQQNQSYLNQFDSNDYWQKVIKQQQQQNQQFVQQIQQQAQHLQQQQQQFLQHLLQQQQQQQQQYQFDMGSMSSSSDTASSTFSNYSPSDSTGSNSFQFNASDYNIDPTSYMSQQTSFNPSQFGYDPTSDILNTLSGQFGNDTLNTMANTFMNSGMDPVGTAANFMSAGFGGVDPMSTAAAIAGCNIM
ncbi:hypothetical protein G6F37_006460 [Rhizopus arrhizus]|nr:hypothetical protein G6F38_000948 [Rhizopus arrhizus]KAG1157711.1 hypothetical protein G6F37_006460 [Rhizopus arrhizus]